jgi:hypothetical protein
MRELYHTLTLLIYIGGCWASPDIPVNETTLSDSVCGGFAINARTAITLVGDTLYSGGDIGIYPGTAITGAYTFMGGGVLVPTPVDFATYMVANHISMLAPQSDWQSIPLELRDATFTPGNYFAPGIITFGAGVCTLDGLNNSNSSFIFHTNTAMITSTGSSFVLLNGARAENVLWVLGTAIVIGSSSVLVGSISAGTAVTMGTNSEVRGCVLAQTAVTSAGGGSFGYLCSAIPGAFCDIAGLEVECPMGFYCVGYLEAPVECPGGMISSAGSSVCVATTTTGEFTTSTTTPQPTSTSLVTTSTTTPQPTSTPLTTTSTTTPEPVSTPLATTSTTTPQTTSTPLGTTSTTTPEPTSTPLVTTSTNTPEPTSTPLVTTSTSTPEPTSTPLVTTSTSTPQPTNTFAVTTSTTTPEITTSITTHETTTQTPPPIPLPPRHFIGRVCTCLSGMEISLPCNSVRDVRCMSPRGIVLNDVIQLSVIVRLEGVNDAIGFDEWLYRAAIAEALGVDFRDILVTDVYLE